MAGWPGWQRGVGGAPGVQAGADLIEQHGEDRFTPWQGEALGVEDSGPRTYERVGFRRDYPEKSEYYILPESFRTVVCKGIDAQLAATALKERGWLTPDKDGKSTWVTRLPGLGRQRCYRITPPEIEEADSE